MKFTIIGAGAIGGTVGAHLRRDGHDVLFCDADPAHVAAINEAGLHITGPVEDFTVRAAAVTPEGLPEQVFGVVLVSVKTPPHGVWSAAAAARPARYRGQHGGLAAERADLRRAVGGGRARRTCWCAS